MQEKKGCYWLLRTTEKLIDIKYDLIFIILEFCLLMKLIVVHLIIVHMLFVKFDTTKGHLEFLLLPFYLYSRSKVDVFLVGEGHASQSISYKLIV